MILAIDVQVQTSEVLSVAITVYPGRVPTWTLVLFSTWHYAIVNKRKGMSGVITPLVFPSNIEV